MKIAVLLSGGVDSSVALSLLQDQGHDLTAFYLKIWLEEEMAYLGNCPWEEDLKYARAVCDAHGVPLEVVSMQREYWNKVVSYAIDELRSGYTPSPDIFCNQRIKFGAFYDHIGDKFDYVATGHYARTEKQGSQVLLKCSPDPVKDQTYFLAHLSQQQIQKAIFPIGTLQKAEVREWALKKSLANANRKDSQGICFLGKIKFRDFAKHHLGTQPGEIIHLDTGKKLGEHQGFWFHTIGQRKGLGLGGGPWYVVRKDTHRNIVYVSGQEKVGNESSNTFFVSEPHWISNAPTEKNLEVKIRHGVHRYGAILEDVSDEEKEESPQRAKKITLDAKDQGIAAGQYTIFYQGDTCLGCSRIVH